MTVVVAVVVQSRTLFRDSLCGCDTCNPPSYNCNTDSIIVVVVVVVAAAAVAVATSWCKGPFWRFSLLWKIVALVERSITIQGHHRHTPPCRTQRWKASVYSKQSNIAVSAWIVTRYQLSVCVCVCVCRLMG